MVGQSHITAPKVVKVLLVEQFLEGFVPIQALYAIMFSRVGHLDLKHIGWLFSIWSLAFLVAELPSGVLADYWSRKKVIMLGNALRATGLVIWLIWPTFTGYAIGFILWGFMIACSSGSTNAYLHNELRANKLDHLFARYYGWINSAIYFGMLISFLFAAVFTLHHTNLLIGVSALASFGGAMVLANAKERPYKKQLTYLKTLQSGLQEFAHSKKLRFLGYGMFSIYMVIGVLEELLPRVYADLGLNNSQVSLLAATALIVSVLLLTKLERFVGFSVSKQHLTMALGLALLIGGLSLHTGYAVILVLGFNLIFQLFRPVFQHHIIQEIKGEERATAASIPSLAGGLFGALAYSIIGWVAQAKSEAFSISAYSCFWLAASLFLAFMGRKYAVHTVVRDKKHIAP